MVKIIAMCLLSLGSISGDWTGFLKLGPDKQLKLVIHTNDDSITLDSPDQGAFGIECETIYHSSDSINFQIPALMMSYQGRLKGDSISGTFRQGGLKLPLSFQAGSIKANRPQTPKPPYHHTPEEVRITNEPDGAILAGTLTIPANADKNTPIAVLVSGSGQQNRDEELFEHKPFAVIADCLARDGIATLRYDDRGVGESTGNTADATTLTFAGDTEAIVNRLRSQHRFGKIGIIGHSEGGLIAYMLGASADAPDFIVSIAGPAIPGSEILDYQNMIALTEAGYSDAEAKQYATEARKHIQADPAQKWMQYFLNHDPAADLQKLKIPTFIIYGEKDRQVPAALNAYAALSLAPNALVKTYAGLNHLMQHANTGSVTEYATIEETISPALLADVIEFINSLK